MRKSSKPGFTLIEVLVVVIIVAVLAAVAVPQYQKAVLKSRFSTLLPIAKSVWQGNELYYLENGKYAANVDELDVSAPANPKVQATLGDEDQHQYVRVSKADVPNRVTMYQKHSPNFADETHCEALLDNASANWLCEKGLQGTFVGNREGYAVYSLSPQTVGTLVRTYYNTPGASFLEGDICMATVKQGCSGGKPTGTRCVTAASAQWYMCQSIRTTARTTCEGNSSNYSCIDAYLNNHSNCIGNAVHACHGVRAWTYSTCEGNKASSCTVWTMDNHSICYGNVSGACNQLDPAYASGYTNSSSCVGEAANTCTGSKFKTHSTCVANAVGACTGATYDATSYCTGNFCPSGAASNTAGKVWYRGEGEDWPDTRESILVDQES